MSKASLYECCVAVNKAQNMNRIRKIMKKAYRDTIKMWNPVLPCFMNYHDILSMNKVYYGGMVALRDAIVKEFGE